MTKEKRVSQEADQEAGHSPQGSPYDKIWRENMKAVMPGIIEKVLKIDVVHSEDLPHKIQVTRQKEVDLLRKIVDREENTFILHIEVQTTDEPMMAYRMLEYRVMITQVYQLPVRQYVLYLGEKDSKMSVSIDLPDLKYHCNLISLNTIPYKLFLSSKYPEEKILAVLGDFGEDAPGQVLRSVVSEITGSPRGDFAQNRYLQQLRIIIQLRNLAKEFNKIMETVSKFFKEEKDPFFIKGESKGELKGKAEVVRNLLKTGRFTMAEIADFANVEEAFVEEINASIIP